MISVPSLCECGCNEVVWNGHRFIHGHNARTNNPATQIGVGAKISKTKKGMGNPKLLGRKYTPVHCKNVSISLLQYTNILTKDFLIEEYVVKKRKTKDIGKSIGCTSSTVVDYLHRHNIPLNKKEGLFGKNNPMYGKHFNHSQSTKDKIAQASKERWECPEHAKRIRECMKLAVNDPEIQKKRSLSQKKLWADPVHRDKMIQRMRSKNNTKPNIPESRILKVIDDHNLPYKYVGNGDVILYGLNPDFINSNGQKKIIEFFGDYWHRDDVVKSWKGTEFGRKAIFSQLGYESLIIWESELNKMTDIELKDTILKFDKK